MFSSAAASDLESTLGVKASGFVAVANLVKAGFPVRALDVFQRRSGLPWSDLERVLRLPSRTLARRRKAGRLAPAESDRLARIAQLFDRTTKLMDDDTAAATAWFLAPCRALNEETPLVVVETEIGAAHVEQLLGRLEHGVFS
jgi:putative toxin-antitoxin system antitoxin component (TIGR02293 family)